MSYNTARPYLASFVLMKKGGKFLSVLRANTGWMDGHYGLPAGKVEIEESGLHAAIREAKEEVGVEIELTDLELALITHRLNRGDHAPEWIDLIYEAKKWKGKPYNAEPKVHDKIAWLDPKNMPDNMVPAVRAYIETIMAGRNYLEYGWED